MADELHAVTRLLLKRMESHPEEFTRGTNRWGGFVEGILEYGNEAEKTALNAAMRDIRLGEIHEWVMDELLTGPERRAEEERQREEQLKTLQQLSAGKGKAYPLTAQGTGIQKVSDMQRDAQKMLNQQLQDVYAQQQPMMTGYPPDLLNQLNQPLGIKK